MVGAHSGVGHSEKLWGVSMSNSSFIPLQTKPVTTNRRLACFTNRLQEGSAYSCSAAPRLVGAHAFTSFSVAHFANGSASGQELAELGPEALCHCGCWGADNFVACHNTAKTTVGEASP